MKITLKLTSFTSLEQYIRDLSYLSIKSITYSRIILHRLTIEWWSWLEAPYAGILVYLSQCCIYMRQWIQVGFGSDNGSAPTRRQAFIWNNAGLLPIAPQGTNFTEILIKNEKTFHSRIGIWTDRLWNGGNLVQRTDELPACGAASECHARFDSTSGGGIRSTCLWGLEDLYVKPSNPAVSYYQSEWALH